MSRIQRSLIWASLILMVATAGLLGWIEGDKAWTLITVFTALAVVQLNCGACGVSDRRKEA
jgi:hypothetical protein